MFLAREEIDEFFALKRGREEAAAEGASGGGRFHFWQDIKM